ncbi:MAG: pseudouridine synthase [Actinomycetes bacterium]|mgnify:FL=1|nr:rRNA pseudouridine synthase [Acidimicrobiia bacterium]
MDERPKLQKAIAHSGLMSRRAAEELIAQGRVTVDGRPARIGQRVDPETQEVAVDGKPIPIRPGLVWYLLYKPVGVISTADDPQGRRTVVDLVPSEPRVYPVGRLDADSEGLIVLTNDGRLANYLTHPRYGVEKTYLVLVEGRPGKWVDQLTGGVELDDGMAAARRARVVDTLKGRTMVEIVMIEGRKREIRRMCSALGHEVVRLVRTAIGPISDRQLKPGTWRHLEPEEVAALYAAASF